MDDIRNTIFKPISKQTVTATVLVEQPGILSGCDAATAEAGNMGLSVLEKKSDRDPVQIGERILRISGTPILIAKAEDRLIGMMAKSSGIATAASAFVRAAEGRARIVCGAWKKMPLEFKGMIRSALAVGGAAPRICDAPFLYLDKNYVRMFGGIAETLDSIRDLKGHQVAIQITGSCLPIEEEAVCAVKGGADLIFVDTGHVDDLIRVNHSLNTAGLRKGIRLAYAGNVSLDQIPSICQNGADIIDVGQKIVDAPLLDMHLVVDSF